MDDPVGSTVLPNNKIPDLPAAAPNIGSIPPGAPLWAKILWYVGVNVAPGIIYQAFDYGMEIGAASGGAEDPAATIWTKWRLEYDDTQSLDKADTQIISFDVLNFTSGVVDSSWTAGDYDVVADQLEAFATNYSSVCVSRLTCKRIAAYRMAFNPVDFTPDAGKTYPPFVQSGSPAFTRTLAIAGGGVATMPPQVRCSVTEETASRRNWGRFYLPTPGVANFGPTGRLTNIQVDWIAQISNNLVSALHSADMHVVVPATMSDGKRIRTLQALNGIHVDDVSDIIRSGRLHETKYRKYYPAPVELATELPADEAAAAPAA